MQIENNNLSLELEYLKMKMLSVVAFGCNKIAEKKISKILPSPFCYYEYFLSSPLLKTDSVSKQNCPLFALFLERVLKKFQFVPKIPENVSNLFEEKYNWKSKITYSPWERSAVKMFLPSPPKLSSISKSLYTNLCFNEWKKNNRLIIDKKSPNELWKKLCKSNRSKNDKESGIRDFLITIAPFGKHNFRKINIILFPIASNEVFYGTIGTTCPDSNNFNIEKISTNLKRIALETYLPVLTLFENYWQEYVTKKGLEEEEWKVLNWENNGIQISQDQGKSKTILRLVFCEVGVNATQIEKKLKFIWGKRKKLYKEKNNSLKKHLMFANYNIASPKMLKLIEKITNLNLKKYNKSLPSALVIGGSGSGKDTLAKLIALFSDDYSTAEIIQLNMASYKPSAISTPLITGLELGKIPKINGLFAQIPEKATLILDELNSLDMDAQGALLRILENAEIIPLGTIKRIQKELNVLVIGVMNEDPEKLTKESTLRQILTQEKLFGGALGEILYEYVRSTRRLREDLYYRLIRGGKFTIPDLDKRREDIPILFYVYAKEFESKIEVDFDVYDILMSEKIKWPGNIRQLQALAKKVIDIKENKVKITAKDVELALKDKDIGLLTAEDEDSGEDEISERVKFR